MKSIPCLNMAYVAIMSLASMALAPAGCAIVTHEETRVVETDAVPLGALVVDTRNGAINVSKTDGGGAVITARLKARSLARLEQTEVVAHRREDGALHIYVEWPDGVAQSNEGCSFDIAVPDADGLQLTTSNGALVVGRGFRGEAILRTSNGAAAIRSHDGPVSLRTSNGAVHAEDISGALDLRTSNGAVSVEDVQGPLEIRTSNGRVVAKLTPDNPGPINVRSSNGNITLRLGDAFKGELELTTSNGSVNMQDVEGMRLRSSSRRHVTLQAGESDAQSIVRTSNGSITISQAN